jgi:YVTN family beta-propeller protein
LDRSGLAYLALVGGAGAALAAAIAIAQAPDTRGGRSGTGIGAADNGRSGPSLVNWETAHVHPMDITPDGTRLLAVNTADNRLSIFDISSGVPSLLFEVPVGLDPISVRARTNTEAWVINNISDSISIVNLTTRNVVHTIGTKDEPSDVIFASGPGGAARAFVTCSTANLVMVFDPANLSAPPQEIQILGKDPRALAVSPDGSKVYAAIFNSGNGSTILGGGATQGIGFPPNVVSDPAGPYGGVNPPPNSGSVFEPPLRPGNPPPPRVGLIVKKDAAGLWMDDNGGNWTNLVSGPQANRSGRVPGWNLPDRDLAVIDASSLGVQYATRLMNINMAIGVNPAGGGAGMVTIVGTDGTNEIRFEPVVNGRFLRVNLAIVNPATLSKTVRDLNPHLNYSGPTIPPSQRQRSIGDPRAIVWNSAGTRGYITGMGSNNVVVVNAAGDRQTTAGAAADTIVVGEGPTGLAIDESRGRLYVLNRFEASISVIDTASEQVVATVPFFDPTPGAIKIGRKHLYNTHRTSGLGYASCASCHVDARMDFLAWDLGEPDGTVKALGPSNLGAGIPGLSPPGVNPPFQSWHPMKGPMTTQTLQDIIGHEPHHWRGDRFGLEEFNGAFMGLLGAPVGLTPAEMQEFEDFLATIHFPPNPYRTIDNTLPTSIPLPGITTSGRYSPPGQPLPPGRPNVGLALYRDTNRRLDGGAFACVTCHTLPTGTGPDMTFSPQQFRFNPIPPGPMGERHHQLVSVDGSTNISIKTPQLRNMYQKMGFNLSLPENILGFGYLHDGSVDTLARFVAEPVFNTASDQETADLAAFLLCFSGSELPQGSINSPLDPPGTPSKDAHAAVGRQTTLVNAATAPATQLQLIQTFITLAHGNRVGLVVKGRIAGEQRGFMYNSATGLFQSDRAAQIVSPAELRALAAAGSELTYTVVPKGSETRIGIDRNENGIYDGDETPPPPPCYANCDESTTAPILNVDDFTCFINQFAMAQSLPHAQQVVHYANCDRSTIAPALNVDDFTCFINEFAQGCR